jgi:2,3-bisphosphoglycerate-dependent phosphoglycerate mutase
VPLEIVFETHGRTEDNAAGIATGWLPGRLSAHGRTDAAALGRRRRHDRIAVVFTSDLRRAVDTAELAFAGTTTPILHDWRLRECDFGSLNGAPAEAVHGARLDHVREPHPGGESWTAATDRVGWFLTDLRRRWDGSRVLVIGHLATQRGLERFAAGRDLGELLAEDFDWREGWEYRLGPEPGS